MLTTIARGRLLVAHRDHGFDVLRRMVEMDEEEPGTLVQAFHLDESDPATFWAYELWQDDAALEQHRDRQRGLRSELTPLVDGAFEVYRCVPLFGKGVRFDGGPVA
jgi:quinol monooxygenase YgiN